MDSVAIRVFTFAILPVIIAAGHLGLDSSSRRRERRLELFLLYLFGIGVAGSGIGGFFGHVFLSDSVAESIGWPTGNPFQLEVGVANLAVGILGIVAMDRRDGFREATVITVTVLGVGATVVHGMDVIESANLAPGNTIQNISNLLRPALLIAFLAASRRAERSPASEAQTSGFDQWRGPRIRAAGIMTGSVTAGFGAGFAIDLPAIGTLVGTLVGAGVAAFAITRASAGISARALIQQPNQGLCTSSPSRCDPTRTDHATVCSKTADCGLTPTALTRLIACSGGHSTSPYWTEPNPTEQNPRPT